MKMHFLRFSILFIYFTTIQSQDLPEGYYAFEESPKRVPPKVRKPPYIQTDIPCPGLGETNEVERNINFDNLCGDLNSGYLPKNPIGPTTYPFELIRNKTLAFFSKTLPVLKEDPSLPKVAKNRPEDKGTSARSKRDDSSNSTNDSEETGRTFKPKSFTGRGFCEKSYGVFCLFYNFWQTTRRRSDNYALHDFMEGDETQVTKRVDQGEPMTPCPSSSEYVTPVFAKNYQGVWRYVVQIPYEGYFTQTSEVIKCLNRRCHYLDGSCLASPRWVSLLVAELFYPLSTFPTPGVSKINSRLGVPSKLTPPYDVSQVFSDEAARSRQKREDAHCDGVDEIGCYQVRMYYDWFLVPGSCKCWRKEFFEKYGQ